MRICPFTIGLIICFFVLFHSSRAQESDNGNTIEVNNTTLYYERFGSGEPLILLHGWTQTGQFWEDYVKAFTDNFEVFVFDLHGHGRSSPLDSTFSIQRCAKDLSLALRQLKIDSAQAIGLSFGGLVLLELVMQNPILLKQMVLMSATPRYNGAENSRLDRNFTYDDLPENFKQTLVMDHKGGEEQVRKLFDPDLDYQIRLSDQQLKMINTKTLIINGDRDEIIGMDGSLILHRALPNSSLWVMPNAGHLVLTSSNLKDIVRATMKFFTEK